MSYVRTSRSSSLRIEGDLTVAGDILPDADNTRSLGGTNEFKDLYIDGTANIDALADGTTFGGDQITKIKTGTYTGDDTTSQAITGIGFTVKFVWIVEHETAEALGGNIHYARFDQYVDDLCFTPYGLDTDDHRIIALGTDGFTVDDNGDDSVPNKGSQVYDYICLG